MGFYVQGKCVETETEALTHLCSTFPLTTIASSNIHTHSCRAVNQSTKTLSILAQTNSGTPVAQTISPKFPSCEYSIVNPQEADFGISAYYFSAAFISTIILFLFAKGIGSVFKLLDNHLK